MTTMTEPVDGRLNVVPEFTTVPPGVNVALGPSMNAVVEPETTAVTSWTNVVPPVLMMGELP